MASLTLLNHSLSSSSFPITKTLNTKTPFSQCLISSSSSNSQFYGLKLSSSSSVTFPSTSSKKFSISAKVNKGSVPPAFTLKDQDNKPVSLSKFKGKPVVLYFYPADETPGCTKQVMLPEGNACADTLSNFGALVYLSKHSGNTTYCCLNIYIACAFRDSYEKFKKAGAQVVGISGDSPDSHKAFAKKFRLPYTLLSDEGNKIRKEWGVPSDLFGTLPGRQTYVLDKNLTVQYIYNNQFQPEKHIDETLKILQSL
ncbi:hypothetical protein C5167_041544 [Papaver somniferum]|nr:hypothetical protein C5167_041544 [Papaver somniferum]